MIAANGSPAGGPTRIGIPVVDLTTGLYAAVGILMALNERQKSGIGQFLETTLFETGLAIMHPHSSNYFFTGKTPVPQGNPHPSLAPYESFETRDGLIFIGIGNDGTFRKLAQEVGKPELGTDERFARNQDRIANREALRAEMEEVFRNFDRDPLCDRLLAAGLPAGPIQSIDKALNSAQSKHRGIVVQKDWYKGVASPIRFDRSKASLRHAPPAFSQHAAEILGEAGLKKEEIDDLVAEGVVSAAKAG
jgi:formyl-CoA transferase